MFRSLNAPVWVHEALGNENTPFPEKYMNHFLSENGEKLPINQIFPFTPQEQAKIKTISEASQIVAKTIAQTWALKRSDQQFTKFKLFIRDLVLTLKISLPIVVVACYYLKVLRSKIALTTKIELGAEYRLFTTSLILANKNYDDERIKNREICKLTGLSIQEVNKMEIEFLESLGYETRVIVEDYFDYLNMLRNL